MIFNASQVSSPRLGAGDVSQCRGVHRLILVDKNVAQAVHLLEF